MSPTYKPTEFEVSWARAGVRVCIRDAKAAERAAIAARERIALFPDAADELNFAADAHEEYARQLRTKARQFVEWLIEHAPPAADVARAARVAEEEQ